jgi:hypothetical protein
VKRVIGPAIVGLVVALCTPVFAQLSKEAAVTKTEALFKNLQEGKSAEMIKEFDTKMAEMVPEEKLKAGWAAMSEKFGTFKTIAERREGRVQERQTVELILAFEKETIVFRAVYDDAGKVSGLVFRPLDQAVLPPAK